MGFYATALGQLQCTPEQEVKIRETKVKHNLSNADIFKIGVEYIARKNGETVFADVKFYE